MRVIKWLGKVALWTVIVVVVLAGALLLVNAVDEDLNPEVAAALKPPHSGLPDEENGFFVILGLTAPAGEGPHAHARRRLADLAGATSFGQVTEISSRYSEKSLAFKDTRGRYCSPTSTSCLAKARQNAEEIRRLIAVNRELFQRYESLYRYTRFEDVVATRAELSGISLAPYSPVLDAQSLKLAQVAVLVEEGRIKEALDELERDIALHRRFAEKSNSLIGKLISQVSLSYDYLFLSEVLREKRGELQAHAQQIRAMATPLGPGQRDFEATLLTELRFTASMQRLVRLHGYGDPYGAANVGLLDVLLGFDPMGEKGGKYRGLDWIAMPFLKDNATLNQVWRYYRRLGEISRGPASAVTDGYGALQRQVQADALNWHAVFNPVGKRLMVLGFAYNWPEYMLRTSDLEGLTRLVALQAEIVARGIADSEVPAIVASSERNLVDPFTEKPMQWDAAARQLWFEPRSERSKREKIGGRDGRIAVGL